MLHLPRIGGVGQDGPLVLYIGTCPRGKQRAVSPDTGFPDHWQSKHCLTQSIMLEVPNLCPAYILDDTGSPTTATTSSSAPSPTSSSSPSTSPPVAPSGGGSKAWIAGAVVGPIVGLGLCAAAYWLWRRHQNHHDRSMGTEREAHGQIADTQIGPQPEKVGELAATPSMLHADSAQRTHEMP